MRRTSKFLLVGLIAVTSIAAAIVLSVNHTVEVNLRPDVNPVPASAPVLNGADVEKILTVEQFRVIRRINEAPLIVKKSFSNFTQLPFDLANPDEEISSDLIIPGRSSRRLVFLAISSDSAVLFYEQGGFANAFNAVVFRFGGGGRGWGATLEQGPIPRDLSGLKTVVQNGKFHPWKGSEG